MNDRQFWDSYLSSMEDLTEEPPPGVKEGVFRKMQRERRRKRLMKGGATALMALLFLGSGAYFLEPWSEEDTSSLADIRFQDSPVSISDQPILPADKEYGKKWGVTEEKEESPKIAEAGNRREERKEVDASSDKGGSHGAEKHSERKEEHRLARSSNGGSEEERKMNGELAEEKDRASGSGKESNASTSSNEVSNEGSVNEEAAERLKPLPTKTPSAEEPDQPNELETGSIEGLAREQLKTTRFFVGSDLAFNFTRLMDRKTMESFKSTSLLDTDGELYFDFGLTGGLQLSSDFRLVGRYFMKKDVGQRYYQYVEGRYTERQVQLSYRNYELLAEYDLMEGTIDGGPNTYLSAYAGGHVGQLRQAERLREGRILEVGEEYKERTYGLEGGMRLGFRSKRGLDVGFLFGGSYSLNSVRSDRTEGSLVEEGARNLSFGGGLSIRYRFGPSL